MRLVVRPEISVAFQNNFGVSISQTLVGNVLCIAPLAGWDIANNTFSPGSSNVPARYPRYQSQTYFVSIQEVKVLVDIWNMYSAPWWLTREPDATQNFRAASPNFNRGFVPNKIRIQVHITPLSSANCWVN